MPLSADARSLDPAVETWALEIPARLPMDAIRELREQLQTALPGKRVVVVTEGAKFRALESLDAALAEAQAELPDGWVLELHSPTPTHIKPLWSAQAWNAHGGVTAGFEDAFADTAVGVLHALTAKLREAQP